MRKFVVFDNQGGNNYTIFAEDIMCLEDVIIFKINDEFSSIVNISNVTAIVEVLQQHEQNIELISKQ